MIGRITKVRMSKDKVELHWEEVKSKTEKETIYRSTERAHPDFYSVLNSLAEQVKGLIGAKAARWSEFTVIGVSFSFSEETKIEGVVVTCQTTLESFSAPLIVNTPHATYAELPPSVVADLTNLRTEAKAYVDGKRMQMELAGTGVS